jgi:hypothetical protein
MNGNLAQHSLLSATQGGDSMSYRQLTAAWTVVLSTLMLPSIHAQDHYANSRSLRAMPIPTRVADRYDPVGIQQSSANRQGLAPTVPAPMAIDANLGSGMEGAGPQQQEGYVQMGAAMYPTPRPNIPIWSGSTMITNQALAPHEMLYPHTYRAMYPPFYHRVKGGWILTPTGVRSHEKWELQGTMVQVKYRSSYPSLLSGAGWHPPATSYIHGPWR